MIAIIVGGGISNTQIITEEGKYALDAVQNNPNVEGTLASKVKKLETTSPIAIKNIIVTNVEVKTKHNDALYFGYVEHFFADNNIPSNNIISIILKNWSGSKYVFGIFAYVSSESLGIMSPAPQTISSIDIRVAYLK